MLIKIKSYYMKDCVNYHFLYVCNTYAYIAVSVCHVEVRVIGSLKFSTSDIIHDNGNLCQFG